MEKYIQITSGRGPAECTLVVAKVLQILLQEAKFLAITAQVIHHTSGDIAGSVDTVVVKLEAKDLNAFLDSWLGTVQWIGSSELRKNHKRKNWFIGIFEVAVSDFEDINEKDIVFQAMRSSGAGGQHVNKVSSAIRAIHVPTDTQVVVMDSRSQIHNRKIALERLLKKLKAIQLDSIKSDEVFQWKNQMKIQRGNPIRVFKGTDFKKNPDERKGRDQNFKYKPDFLSD